MARCFEIPRVLVAGRSDGRVFRRQGVVVVVWSGAQRPELTWTLAAFFSPVSWSGSCATAGEWRSRLLITKCSSEVFSAAPAAFLEAPPPACAPPSCDAGVTAEKTVETVEAVEVPETVENDGECRGWLGVAPLGVE